MAKRKSDRADIRKSLADKLSACAIDEYAGLNEEEQRELLLEAQEYALRWVLDHAKHRIGKGSGAATSMLQIIASRLDVIEDREIVKSENKAMGELKKLTIVYQEPSAEVLARIEGATDDGNDQQT